MQEVCQWRLEIQCGFSTCAFTSVQPRHRKKHRINVAAFSCRCCAGYRSCPLCSYCTFCKRIWGDETGKAVHHFGVSSLCRLVLLSSVCLRQSFAKSVPHLPRTPKEMGKSRESSSGKHHQQVECRSCPLCVSNGHHHVFVSVCRR